MHNIDWGDLRYVLAVAKHGSAAAAARALNVNHSTVVRRIKAFEKAQGLRLFDHLASGYRLTPEGEVFLDAARTIDATVTELERKIIGGQTALAGTVRVTTTDGLFPLLRQGIADFRQAYPGIALELLITNLHLNLDTLDADIAIRPTRSPPPNLVGRRACEVTFAVYAAEVLQQQDGMFGSFYEMPWLGLNEPLSASVPGRWLSETIPDERVAVRCNSFLSLLALVEQGMGCAVLPCYLGDGSPLARRVMPDPLPFRVQVWLLSHRDVLRSPRILACTDFFHQYLRQQRLMFEPPIAC